MSCCKPELTEGTVAVGAPTLDDADAERRGDGGGRRDVDIQARWQDKSFPVSHDCNKNYISNRKTSRAEVETCSGSKN